MFCLLKANQVVYEQTFLVSTTGSCIIERQIHKCDSKASAILENPIRVSWISKPVSWISKQYRGFPSFSFVDFQFKSIVPERNGLASFQRMHRRLQFTNNSGRSDHSARQGWCSDVPGWRRDQGACRWCTDITVCLEGVTTFALLKQHRVLQTRRTNLPQAQYMP